ncbi:putative Isoprenylcysteine carboxyl methyltransferase [Candidatus Sulfotelmatomonas gaucii]|uniref:Putative Isoprenylcysteine carboxyl methyltransferase n=1 Tax=Candidatus Sulfuritelmatomonas gaucii TaxID=2043161 RepID=A0A2N9LWK9_9BACT|nr:putative Isoprenylcysteine carboxyl methyltransferase [Candidatus Sulfotelmatomonas gaucii]
MSALTGLFIALCWTVLSVYMICAAFSASRRVESDRGWNWSWLVFAVIVVLFLLLRNDDHLPPYVTWAILPHTPFACFGADLLVLAGLIVALWGRIALGKNWNLYPSFQENHELIQSGPYAYVRHPMYSGLILMFLGTVAWYGTGLGIILFIASLLGIWFKLRQEERILTGHFGAAYASYEERVKALIPFVL